MIPFGAKAYWVKAKLFVNRALEDDETSSEDERRLWASLALEILAKWALSETSPTLVADPVNGSGEQLTKALGLKTGHPYIAVAASTAFKRCAAIYSPFDAPKAQKYAEARNEYLHGTEVAVLGLPDRVWWSQLWSLISVLLATHGRDVSELVGREHASAVELLLEENKRWVIEQYEAKISAAKRNLHRFEQGLMAAHEANRWVRDRNAGYAGMEYSDEQVCPACSQLGTVEGEEADRVDPYYPGDEYGPRAIVTFTPVHFSCSNCHLLLDTYELVAAAGLNEEHETDSEEPVYDEPLYGND